MDAFAKALELQLIKIPIRDWNNAPVARASSAELELQLIKIPIRDWNFVGRILEAQPVRLQLIKIPIRDWNIIVFPWCGNVCCIAINQNPY